MNWLARLLTAVEITLLTRKAIHARFGVSYEDDLPPEKPRIRIRPCNRSPGGYVLVDNKTKKDRYSGHKCKK